LKLIFNFAVFCLLIIFLLYVISYSPCVILQIQFSLEPS
jgi:hypothetical protein